MPRPRFISPGKAIDTRMSPSDLLRFLGRVAVHPVTQCWIWTGHTDDKGYGQFSWHGKPQWAHRLAYATFVAPVPAGLQVDHQEPCHNPSCVNPDHLRLLTHGENSADANGRRGESSGVNALADMKITAIEPRFGSKRTLAPVIVEELGKHSAYWEPFCGGMSVLLEKPESSHETVNDLDGSLINLARVIADRKLGPMLYRRLRRPMCDEILRDEILAMLPIEDPLEQAYRYFIVSWFGRNGFSGTIGCDKSSFAVRWTKNGGHGGKRFKSTVESIPAWRRRMRRVTILSRDAFEILGQIDDADGIVIYVDPPYIEKDATYLFDFKPDPAGIFDDHTRLAQQLSRFTKTRVVVSYYEHSRLAELYPLDRWTRRNCAINKGIHNAGRRGSVGKKAPEVLLINGPSFAEVA